MAAGRWSSAVGRLCVHRTHNLPTYHTDLNSLPSPLQYVDVALLTLTVLYRWVRAFSWIVCMIESEAYLREYGVGSVLGDSHTAVIFHEVTSVIMSLK